LYQGRCQARHEPDADAIGLAPGTDPDWVIAALKPLGYQLRGHRRDAGGLLLVLEDRPAHRVAHLHLVGHGDAQWRRYLALRDRLRADPGCEPSSVMHQHDMPTAN
jgi:GrpB-like predicted nucleotidyltransferase (UPF0157 family)